MPPTAPKLEIEITQNYPAWCEGDLNSITTALEACWTIKNSPVFEASFLKYLPHAPYAEVSIVLSDDDAIQILNKDWRAQDKPTNVLSFPAQDDTDIPTIKPPSDMGFILGDIIFARQTILHEAKAQNKTISDHLSHLSIHGLLHLLGYDHIDDQDAEEMEMLEVKVLHSLNIANPYEFNDQKIS